MPYPVKAVANYFLDLAEVEGRRLTPMQLQKLVYFAHGWHLALTGTPLVDEQVEAWPYGPVFPSLYRACKQYGGGPILRTLPQTTDGDVDPVISSHAKSILNRVWAVYGAWSAVQLSQLTHVAGGPWDVTLRRNPGRKGTDIADSEIQAYFLKKASKEA